LKGNLKGLENIYLQAGGIKVSAIFLAAKSSIETRTGYSDLATGSVEGYKGWYNMYGLDACDGTDSSTKAACAAKQRGWNTREKAILGGADKIYTNWIKDGQDTLYTMDWNIEGYKKEKIANHQYATHIKDAFNKADEFAKGLKTCNVAFVFKIPVSEK
jgi:beta-N-acetylglucosaminidase